MQRAGRIALAVRRQIAERDDADEMLVTVDHRQAANLMIAHQLDDVVDVIVVEAPPHIVRHDVLHARGVGREAGGRGPDGDVAVGHHAAQTSSVTDGKRADIHLVHETRRLLDRPVRTDHAHVAGHDLCDFHELPLQQGHALGAGLMRGATERTNNTPLYR